MVCGVVCDACGQAYFRVCEFDREDALYSVDLTTKALKKVAAGGIGMYTADDDFLYYADDSSDGFVYRIDLATGEKSLLLDEPHASNL